MKQERKAWILLGSIFLVFVLYTPKKQQKHESKVKIQYGNYERLPDAYYRFKQLTQKTMSSKQLIKELIQDLMKDIIILNTEISKLQEKNRELEKTNFEIQRELNFQKNTITEL